MNFLLTVHLFPLHSCPYLLCFYTKRLVKALGLEKILMVGLSVLPGWSLNFNWFSKVKFF